MTTSAHFETAATVSTVRPAAIAFARERLVSGSPTRTSTPLSLRFSECAWPCDP